ncbi:MAG: extracellular solute-binding protein [Treponema sp.]|nr:extracellular solute-binding protein [Treponema sp.]
MKALKKIMVAGLFACVAVSSITAAPKKKMSKEEKAEMKKLEKMYKDQPEFIDPATGKPYDFGGMEVIIADWWSDPKGADTVPAKTKVEEDRRNWHKYLGYKYNFRCTEKGIGSWGSHPQSVANYCVLGGEENYVFVIDMRSVTTGVKSKLYYDMSKSKDVDWTQKKYDKATTELMTKNGAVYGCRPMAPEPRTGLFFNKRLLSEANIDPDSIYDMQKKGTWTWANFEKVLKQVTRDIDNDGVVDVWGMANHNTEVCHVILESNCGSVIAKDKNGKFINNIESEASIEAMEWGNKMHNLYEMPQPEGSEWNWMYAAFMNGDAAFMAEQEYFVDTLADMQDDWGFVCWPIGPRAKDYRCVNIDNIYVVPSVYGDERAAKITKIFDIYQTEAPGYDGGDAWKEDFYARFRDERAVDETLAIMRDHGSTLLSKLVPGLEPGDVFWTVYPGWETMQEACDKVRNSWQGLINEVNK